MLVSTPGRSPRTRVLTGGEIPAPVLISDNLPRRPCFPPPPGQPAKRFDWTPGGRGWELGAGSRQLAGEIRMFNHWAAGLRSGLLPEGCGVATPEMCKKMPPKFGSLPYGFDVWRQGMHFLIALAGSRGCGGGFLLGVCQQIVR